MRAECRTKVEAEIGRPLDEGDAWFIDRAIALQLTRAARENRQAFRAMSYPQQIRMAGARAAQEIRGYRHKGSSWSKQDKADIEAALQREITKAGAKLGITLEDSADFIAEYQDRMISFALNQIEGKTVNGIMKALQGTLSHELLHWARSMGFYDDQQWATLVSAAGKLRMSKADAKAANRLEAWQRFKEDNRTSPTFQQMANIIYGDLTDWKRQEEAVAMAMEAARGRYEQETVDPNDTIWRKALGSLIKAGRAVVRAIGTLTKDQQTRLRNYIDDQQSALRSGATARQAPAFSKEGLEPSQDIKVSRIKEAINTAFQTEEINDLIRRIEDPKMSAAEIAAAPIWSSIAEKQEGPTVTGAQTRKDSEWWGKRTYPHPDGGDELIPPSEMAKYVRSMFESRATSKVKKQKRATIITGAPGAGKSTISRQIASKSGAAVIEADAVMELIPEYNGGINAEDVWGESSALTQQALNWLIEDGSNIVHERIGEDIEVLSKYVAHLKAAGYTVDLVNINTDFTTRMRRMGARFLATGRSIPIERMVNIGNRPTYVHRTAARMGLADGYYEVESGKGKGYRIISRSGAPRPGTTRGVRAASGGRMAGIGRGVFGQRPPVPLKETAIEYAKLFRQWDETAGYALDKANNIGGPGAKGADLSALKEAKKLAKAGADANTIKQKTGWYRPKIGGKWRFNLPSGKIKIKPAFAEMYLARNPPKGKLTDILFHSRKLSDLIDTPVFEQYPFLKNVRVVVDRDYDGAGANSFLNTIVIGRVTDATFEETLAHEMQHLISNFEKFQSGGSPTHLARVLRSGHGWNVKPPQWAIDKAEKGWPDADSLMSRALSIYLALVDEVQARQAEKMVNMTEEQRKALDPDVMNLDTIDRNDITNAWKHLQAMPLKLLAGFSVAGGVAGVSGYNLVKMLVDMMSAQSFNPKDAFALPEVIAATKDIEESPLVHQEFGLTKEQSAKFDKMRQYKPIAKAMDEIGISEKPKRITRAQYTKLRRAMDAISDEDFISDNMRTSARIVGRKMVQSYLKDEKAFKVFLEHGIIDGGFVGTDRPGENLKKEIDLGDGVIKNPSKATIYRMTKPVRGKEKYQTDTIRYIKSPSGDVYVANGFEKTHDDIGRIIKSKGEDTTGFGMKEDGRYADGDWKRGYAKRDGNTFPGPGIMDIIPNFTAMQSRTYTPPGGRFGATTSASKYKHIGEQSGYLDDAAYVGQQFAAIPKMKGLWGTTIQDKRMRKLKPWNVAFGQLDAVDKLVEGSLKAAWGAAFRSTPILNQLSSKASTYFQFGGVPDQAALEVFRTIFQGKVGQAEELAAGLARDVSEGLNLKPEDAWKALRGDFSGINKLQPDVRAKVKDQIYQLKKAMTEENPTKQNIMIVGGTFAGEKFKPLPPALQKAGRRAMEAIKEVGDALVEHKVIHAKQRDKFTGHYLLRAYIEHLDDYGPTLGTKASGAPYRKWRESIPKDKRLTKGEIEHLPFLLYMSIERPLHDIAAYTYLNSLIHHSMTSPTNPRWFMPEGFVMFGGKFRSLFYVAQEIKSAETQLAQKAAELSSIGGGKASGLLASDLRAEIAALSRAIHDMKMIINTNPAYATMLASGEIPDGYRQLPGDISRYGDAAGGIVIEQLYFDITGAGMMGGDPDTVPGKAQELYASFNRNVKFLLTVANPPTHLRNVYSNAIMLARSGTNPLRVIEALNDIIAYNGGKGKASRAIEVARKFGAMKQTFTEAELRVLDEFARGIRDELEKAKFRKSAQKLTGGPSQLLDDALNAMDIATAIAGGLKNAYADGMSFLYQMEDVIFKVAKIEDELDRGTPDALAALEARKYFFDYSAVTPFIRWMSNSALAPFIRYTYFAVPNFLEQLGTAPWRLAYTGYGQYIGLMALAAMMWGFAPEEAKETLSDYLKERPMMIPVPWRDSHDRIQWVDLGYILPEGSLIGLAMSASEGDPIAAVRALGVTGGPAMTLAAGWLTGTDPFRGTPIYDEIDNDQTRAIKLSAFTMRSFMPSFYGYYTPPINLGGEGETQGSPGYEAVFGTGVDRYGEPTQTYEQLASRAFGFNVYPNDVLYGRLKRVREFEYSLNTISQELDRVARARNLTEEAREQRIAQLQRDLERVMADRAEFIRVTTEVAEAESRRQQERE